MNGFREVTCPSGNVLKVIPAPFGEALDLHDALTDELKGIKFGSKDEVASLMKDIYCYGFSSKRVRGALDICMARCIYNDGKGDLKVTKEAFEPVKNRQDYTTVCIEVMKENISPFFQNLLQLLPQLAVTLGGIPGQK